MTHPDRETTATGRAGRLPAHSSGMVGASLAERAVPRYPRPTDGDPDQSSKQQAQDGTQAGAPVTSRPAGSRRGVRVRDGGIREAALGRTRLGEPLLAEDDLRLLAEVATGATADVAARRLELSSRTLRRRLRGICDRLDVSTPIEAVVWAARRQLI